MYVRVRVLICMYVFLFHFSFLLFFPFLCFVFRTSPVCSRNRSLRRRARNYASSIALQPYARRLAHARGEERPLGTLARYVLL